MAKFKLQIDVEPEDIPSLDDAHKHDCANALLQTINRIFKYTVFFSLITAGLFGVYSIIGFWWGLRMQITLPQMSPVIPIIALVILALEFISGTMNRWALILEIVLHIALTITAVSALQTLLIAPFAVYGIIQHIKLITLIPIYNAISSQKGYPDFMPPLSRDMLDSAALKKEETEKVPEAEAAETGSDKDNVDDNSQTDSKLSANNQ